MVIFSIKKQVRKVGLNVGGGRLIRKGGVGCEWVGRLNGVVFGRSVGWAWRWVR
ncbi:hypothetical protein [Moraxella bovis]|uniref:hypothetical protein n=1 Tax=Moraxella bovis TaxID=476 RepID=UPI00227BCC9F|nr:hypothetical protein [Moraxella bovis]WAJ72986.1 hypothetical protein LP095_09555 [Moraxella bovis]